MTTSWTEPTHTTAGKHIPEGAYYDEAAADRVVKFCGLLTIPEGKGAGEPVQLMAWMEHAVLRPLFGWRRADGTRLYRSCYVEIPRKNGKTFLAAAISLYMLVADGEAGAQVIMGARDRAQARLCYDMARKLVSGSPALRKRCRVTRSYIEHAASSSVLRAVSADASNQHGLNASCIVADELHVHRDRELYEVLATSVGARAQPIVFGITTAGVYDPFSIAWEQREYAVLNASGELKDPTFLGVIYGTDKDDDWTDPEVWRRANPSLGVTITEDYLREEVERARVSPARQSSFRRLHLGQWTTEVERWLDPAAWAECGEPLREPTPFMPVYAGLDLSSTTDVSALSILRRCDDETYDVEVYAWLPEADLLERERRDRIPYREWVAAGYLTLTPGNLVDYAYIKAKVFELADKYPGLSIAYDPWNATGLITELMGAGLPCLPTRQGFATMSAPTKEMERLVLGKRLRHANHPLLTSHVLAARVTTDAANNAKVTKSATASRVDACVATIMALNSAMLAGGLENYRSVYETRGVTSIP